MNNIRNVKSGYKEVDELGAGTYGSVSKVEETKTGEYFALKNFKLYEEDYDSDDDDHLPGLDLDLYNIIPSQSFMRELSVYAEIENDYRARKYLPRCYGYATNSGYSLLLELFNQDLNRRVFTPEELIKVYKDLLQSLNILHDHGIIHRDIKPSNMLYSRSQNKVVLTDLGSGRIIKRLPKVREATVGATTELYSPPEIITYSFQRDAPWKYDHAMDIWSLGVSFINLTGIEWILNDKRSYYFYPVLVNLYKDYTLFDGPDFLRDAKEKLLVIKARTGEDVSELLQLTENIENDKTSTYTYPPVKQLYDDENDNTEEDSDYYDIAIYDRVEMHKTFLMKRIDELFEKHHLNTGKYTSDRLRNILTEQLMSKYTNPQIKILLDIIMPMLEWEPENRSSAKELLRLPIFNDGLTVEIVEEPLLSYQDLKPLSNETVERLKKDNITYVPYMSEIRNRQLRKSCQFIYRDVLQLSPELSYSYYSIIVEWMHNVVMKCHYAKESLFIGIEILDDYLTKNTVPLNKLHLIGATCLYLGTQYQEVYPTDLVVFMNLTSEAYSQNDFRRCVKNIMSTISAKVFIKPCLSNIVIEIGRERDYTVSALFRLEYLSLILTSFLRQEIIGMSQQQVLKLVLDFIDHGEVTNPRITQTLRDSMRPDYRRYKHMKKEVMSHFDNK